jgi:tripartite-type tricarboxylate transporter receptor subunit TctC
MHRPGILSLPALTAAEPQRNSLARRARSLVFAAVVASGSAMSPAAAQPADYYYGKTLKILVGLQVGGTADTFVRRFADYLKKHLAGNPTVLIENMTGAGGNLVFNYLAEKAQPDGLTIVYSPYQALGQALEDRSLRARFENLEYLGGISDTRIGYMRADAVPGGAKKPSDIVKADNLIVGAYTHTDFESTLSHLSLDVLGVKHKLVVGYRGGADIFLAMQRREVQFHSTSIGTYRTRSAAFIQSGEGIGVYYLVSTGPGGEFEKNKLITDVPAFPDLYREVYGKLPAGENWDALNWLTTQTSELAYAAFAPRGTGPAALSALRTAFDRAARDPDFIEKSVASNGIPYSPVDVARGRAIIRSLADVSPGVLKALRASMGVQN